MAFLFVSLPAAPFSEVWLHHQVQEPMILGLVDSLC